MLKLVKRVLSMLFAVGLTVFSSGCETAGQNPSAFRSAGSTQSAGTDTLAAVFLDSWLAGSIVLVTDSSAVMVDTGTSDTADDLLKSLNDFGITTINYLILTHFDQEHISGAVRILQGISVSHILTTSESGIEGLEDFQAALEEKNLTAEQIGEVTKFMVDGTEYTVYPAEDTSYQQDTVSNASLVVKVSLNDVSFLLTGDIQEERIRELLAGNVDLDADVLKMPNHGIYENNTRALIEAVSPEYAVITCSDTEREDAQTENALENAEVTAFLTREGSVVFTTDGTTLSVIQSGQ